MLKLAIASLLASAVLSAPAMAGAITFDLGNAGHSGSQTSASQTLNSQGIFNGGGEVTFTNSGASVSAEGFGGRIFNCGSDHCVGSEFVTQKPGSFGPGETGIGESNFQNFQSNSDREVTSSTYLVLDNRALIADGYLESELVLESLQAGEGVRIYGLSSLGSSLDLNNLNASNLLATLVGCPATVSCGPVTQSVSLTTDNYFVLNAIPRNADNQSSNDFILSEDIVSKVPEPLTVSLFGAGLIGAFRLRRRKAA